MSSRLPKWVHLVWKLYSYKDRQKLAIILLLQIALQVLDLLGVVGIALLGSIATLGITNQEAGGTTQRLLNLFSLDALSQEQQIAIVGFVSVLCLLIKTTSSLIVTNRSLRFLSYRSAEIATSLVERVIKEDVVGLSRFTSSQIRHSLAQGIGTISVGIVQQFLALVVDLVLLLALSAALFIAEPVLAFLVMTFFSLIAVFLYSKLSREARVLGREMSLLFLETDKHIHELLGVYRGLIVSNSRKNYVEKIGKNRREIAERLIKLSNHPNLTKFAAEVGFVVGACLIVTYQFLGGNSSRSAAILGLFIASSLRIGPAILRVQQSLTTIKRSLGQSDPTFELIEELNWPNDSTTVEYQLTKETKEQFQASLIFESVGYSYPNSDRPVIKNLSFQVNKGEHLAIIGRSGVGKSTLVDLAIGALKPITGRVLISGESPLKAFEVWPEKVAFMEQKVFIAPETIRYNLLLGHPNMDIKEVALWNALEKAELSNFVSELPNKLDFVLTENGSNMSGGQLQRLGLARAFLGSPEVLILDEPTSALDNETQDAVGETINSLKGQLTVLIIAHRLETIKRCDRVLHLYESGEYQELNPEQVDTLVLESDLD